MIRRLAFALSLGLGLTLGLLWVMEGQKDVALADPGILHVALGGDCGGATPCCATVQDAVDAAGASDEIRVAAGTYTGVSGRAGITQTVYISKTVTIRGGYTTVNWTMSNPAANPTTLDAQGLGRVLVISGTIAPSIEGLRLTRGDATGLGGDRWGRDAGGGVYVYEAVTAISDCVVYSNTASTASLGYGGGLYLCYSDDATLSGNTVQGNMASTASGGYGGGLYLYYSYYATLSGNTVQGNTASTASSGDGGGLYFYYSYYATLNGNMVQGNTASTAAYGYGGGLYLYYGYDATLSGNTVQGNTATTASTGYGFGGGLYLEGSDATTLSGNTVQGNIASTASGGSGGGLYLGNSDATLSGNMVVSNTTSTASWGYGGGLYLYCSDAALINNVVADNQANTQGSGLYFKGSDTDPTSGRLLHTTIAHNRSSGQGVYVGDYTTLAFTNTIIAGHHSVGIIITAGNMATLNATLWHANTANWDGAGTINRSNDHSGDPAFDIDGYHLSSASAAIDAGVDAGVTTDIDGDPRPMGRSYDIGADEFRKWYVYLPLVVKNCAH